MMESSLAQNGYAATAQTISSDRGLEYQVFARITQELSSLRPEAPDYHAKMIAALNRNMKLWTILSVEVSEENNRLPKELRAKIFQLAEFTRAHTAKVYAGEADPTVLVEINTMVMRGLRNGPSTESGESCLAD